MSQSPTLIAGALLAALATAAPAAAQDAAAMQAKYEKKLQAEFIEHGGWIIDFDEAKEKAKAEDKLIFAYFSRSYAP